MIKNLLIKIKDYLNIEKKLIFQIKKLNKLIDTYPKL